MRYRQFQPYDTQYVSQFVPLPLEFMANSMNAQQQKRDLAQSELDNLAFNTKTNTLQTEGGRELDKQYYEKTKDLGRKMSGTFDGVSASDILSLKRQYQLDPERAMLEMNYADEENYRKQKEKLGKEYWKAGDTFGRAYYTPSYEAFETDKSGKKKAKRMAFDNLYSAYDSEKDINATVGHAQKALQEESAAYATGNGYIRSYDRATNNIMYRDKNGKVVGSKLNSIATTSLDSNKELLDKFRREANDEAYDAYVSGRIEKDDIDTATNQLYKQKYDTTVERIITESLVSTSHDSMGSDATFLHNADKADEARTIPVQSTFTAQGQKTASSPTSNYINSNPVKTSSYIVDNLKLIGNLFLPGVGGYLGGKVTESLNKPITESEVTKQVQNIVSTPQGMNKLRTYMSSQPEDRQGTMSGVLYVLEKNGKIPKGTYFSMNDATNKLDKTFRKYNKGYAEKPLDEQIDDIKGYEKQYNDKGFSYGIDAPLSSKIQLENTIAHFGSGVDKEGKMDKKDLVSGLTKYGKIIDNVTGEEVTVEDIVGDIKSDKPTVRWIGDQGPLGVSSGAEEMQVDNKSYSIVVDPRKKDAMNNIYNAGKAWTSAAGVSEFEAKTYGGQSTGWKVKVETEPLPLLDDENLQKNYYKGRNANVTITDPSGNVRVNQPLQNGDIKQYMQYIDQLINSSIYSK